jgi:hypothetical protein
MGHPTDQAPLREALLPAVHKAVARAVVHKVHRPEEDPAALPQVAVRVVLDPAVLPGWKNLPPKPASIASG